MFSYIKKGIIKVNEGFLYLYSKMIIIKNLCDVQKKR